jgi:hypothetical protein
MTHPSIAVDRARLARGLVTLSHWESDGMWWAPWTWGSGHFVVEWDSADAKRHLSLPKGWA